MDCGVNSDPMDISKYDMETDISQMEAPTFTTIDRSNPASMLTLDWDHKVNLVGKKVLNPMIHCCDKCLKPILIYGRMIPCKHVFCLGCAKQEGTTCPRCGDKVNRVEQAGLGNIFLCTQGGSRYGNTGCRRTYLSSRDLAAHVAHRHKEKGAKETEANRGARKLPDLSGPLANISKASLASVVAAVNSAQASFAGAQQQATAYPTQSYQGSEGGHGNHISVLNSRPGNLITIHAQEGGGGGVVPPAGGTVPGTTGYSSTYPPAGSGYSAYPTGSAPPPAGSTYPNMSQPPPTYGYTSTGYTAPGPAQYPTPGYGGAAAGPPGPTAGYPATGGGAAPATTYSAAPGGQGVGPAGYTGGQYGAGQGAAAGYGTQQWTRPPPAQGGQGYYRR